MKKRTEKAIDQIWQQICVTNIKHPPGYETIGQLRIRRAKQKSRPIP